MLSEPQIHAHGSIQERKSRFLFRCVQDKVNISVAIIPMAKAFGWSPTVAGLVQSSFFWGYIVSQIPGGYVNSRYGGRTVLPLGVGLWSGATAAVPVLAGTIPGACLCNRVNRTHTLHVACPGAHAAWPPLQCIGPLRWTCGLIRCSRLPHRHMQPSSG